MNIKSLQFKNYLVDDNGDNYIDLSQPSLKNGSYSGIKDIFQVDSETEMRADLISLKFYGSTEHIDILLKANNLFNPFCIKEGDLLVIPNILTDSAMYKKPNTGNKKDLRQNFVDKARLSSKDQNRVDRLKQKANGKEGAVANPMSPNLLQIGSNTQELKNGEIILGKK